MSKDRQKAIRDAIRVASKRIALQSRKARNEHLEFAADDLVARPLSESRNSSS